MRLALYGAVLLLFRLASALYEEQAGFLDWHKENIGSVKQAHFAPRGRERIFVATDAAVVASLDTRDGSIVWRQVCSNSFSELLSLQMFPSKREESAGFLLQPPKPSTRTMILGRKHKDHTALQDRWRDNAAFFQIGQCTG